jgi:plastocyanin
MKFSSVRNCGVSGLTILCLASMTAGCGGGDSSPADPTNGNGNDNGNGNGNDNGNGGLVATTLVDVRDSFFDPDGIQVGPGAVVTFTWQGNESHNVTWVDAGLTSSPTQIQGTHEVTMPGSAGDFGYYCTIHGTPTSGMHGRVVVD